MGRPKRLYPLGKYRLRTPKEIDKAKAYLILTMTNGKIK